MWGLRPLPSSLQLWAAISARGTSALPALGRTSVVCWSLGFVPPTATPWRLSRRRGAAAPQSAGRCSLLSAGIAFVGMPSRVCRLRTGMGRPWTFFALRLPPMESSLTVESSGRGLFCAPALRYGSTHDREPFVFPTPCNATGPLPPGCFHEAVRNKKTSSTSPSSSSSSSSS